MKRQLKIIAIAAAAAATVAIAGAGAASARHGGSALRLSLHQCAPGTVQTGVVRFQNVGNQDFNEGARNYIAIRLCSARRFSPVYLSRGYCGGRLVSRTGFRNVGNNDRYEGAPHVVRLSLCARRPHRRRFAISTRHCPAGTRTISAVRFQNVGNNDFNEGARNFVTVRLCARRWA